MRPPSSLKDKSTPTSRFALIGLLSIVLIFVSVIAAIFGSSTVGYQDLLALIFGKDLSSAAENILVNVRLPRVAAGLLAGAALACSGAIIQGVLNNPLASPNVLGINAGAGFAVLIVSACIPSAYAHLPLAAFAGALITSLFIFAVSLRSKASKLSVVLAGLAMTSIFSAGMKTILILNPDAYIGSSTFIVGGLAGVRFSDLFYPAIYIGIGLIIAFYLAQKLNILSLGDETAHSLGIHITRARITSLAVAAVLAGAAVSFAGLLGFVGLIIPHLVRFFVGNDNRVVLPVSVLVGSIFVVICDLFSRVAFSPYELPVGITMAFIGGPFFIYLILRYRGGNFE